jgi:hypothetical protein
VFTILITETTVKKIQIIFPALRLIKKPVNIAEYHAPHTPINNGTETIVNKIQIVSLAPLLIKKSVNIAEYHAPQTIIKDGTETIVNTKINQQPLNKYSTIYSLFNKNNTTISKTYYQKIKPLTRPLQSTIIKAKMEIKWQNHIPEYLTQVVERANF